MRLTVEIEMELIQKTKDTREHYKINAVMFEGSAVKSELSMDRSGSEYWPFFEDGNLTLSVIADEG